MIVVAIASVAIIAYAAFSVFGLKRSTHSSEEMITRLLAIINDPAASAAEKAGARRRLDHLTMQRAKANVHPDRKHHRDWRVVEMRADAKRYAVRTIAGGAWLGFCALQYFSAASRIEECRHSYLYDAQASICIRHAIEARDAVLLWGAAPLVVLALVYAYRITRDGREK